MSTEPAAREPIFNLPTVVTALIGLMAAIHVAATFALDDAGREQLTVWLAFIPYRIEAPSLIPGGLWPLLWTPITHAFLHGGWEHLGLNMAWLMIFGTPVARRYGAVPTLLLFIASAVAGAGLFMATSLGQVQVLVGASGGIAGLTGAACRFMFQPVLMRIDPETGLPVPAGRATAPLALLIRDRRAMAFIAVWVVLNAAVPLYALVAGGGVSIAWQAHIGGFAAGLLGLPLVERWARAQR
jgi:membrane associated rhomboid family serine protease